MKEVARVLARSFDDRDDAIEVEVGRSRLDRGATPPLGASTPGHSDDRGLARWLTCLGRGHHDFDAEGICCDCDAPRTT